MSADRGTIPNLLIRNIPRDLVMGVEDALNAGAKRAFERAHDAHQGHRASVLGQLRHFHMNEDYQQSLAVAGASPTPIRGNAVVVGRAGIVALGRFNISAGIWNTARRSSTRQQMALANLSIEPLVQPTLFDAGLPVTEVTAFFVASFSRTYPENPISIDIAVPDSSMTGWLFREPLSQFLARYDAATQQADIAIPKLKPQVGKKTDQNE